MKKVLLLVLMIALAAVSAACADERPADGNAPAPAAKVHVAAGGSDETGDGSEESPYATPAFAAENAGAGSEVIVHEGTYGQFEINGLSGTEKEPVVFRAADGEKAVIESVPGDESAGIHIVDSGNIVIDGFEVTGGTCGIYYESTPGVEGHPENITIRNCRVHGVRGVHGICAYARNDRVPVRNLVLEGCEVYDCECGDSESTVVNGNIDGFTIRDNIIHDNDNIGIDMIGFEGTAEHRNGSGNPFDSDFVRNGECCGNVVYNISTEGNDAYIEDGGYSLCAGGIYVDGGRDIKIHDNFVFSCDIGIEVATEHSPDDNELFRVSGIEVHDNVIAGCKGLCGLCFGGYDADLGFTEDCIFRNNTLADNAVSVLVQRSRGNRIYDNIFSGTGEEIEYSDEIPPRDMDNEFAGNESSPDGKGLLDGFESLKEGKGSAFVPDDKYIKIYEETSR